MSTRDSSVTPSHASSSTDISWHTSTNEASEATENTARPSSRQNRVKPSTSPEADVVPEPKPKDSHSASDEASVLRSLQATPAIDSGPVCDIGFNFRDTNVQIRTEDRLFRIHQFKLGEFDRLRPMLEQAAKDDKERKTIKLPDSADDFHNLLTVLYSSVYDVHLFSSAILKSTLKLATKYAHPTLRTFAIKELEKHTLEPIERFALSRDCGVTEWMPKAVDDLCWREGPITVAEAQILGPEKFVEVAARREGILFERGSRVGLSSGKQTLLIEAASELTRASPPVSQDLGDILAASNTLLATTSKNIQPTSKEGSDSIMPVDNSMSDRFSFGPPKESSVKVQPATSGFGSFKFGDKPLPLPFSFESKPTQSKAPAPSPFRQIKGLGTAGKGPTP
ncbi:unnamed protein product [Rhizoctonia solani]|uniref:BTB domain-containing protein n=1 Tax=Rhizoctonia solani TaxID=456999 RepID=A0A8H3HQ79_9AGAM|nr:unnamed protein product [Rhizoctonia solani]